MYMEAENRPGIPIPLRPEYRQEVPSPSAARGSRR